MDEEEYKNNYLNLWCCDYFWIWYDAKREYMANGRSIKEEEVDLLYDNYVAEHNSVGD